MANPLNRVKSFFSRVAKTISESPIGKAFRAIGEKIGIIKPKPPPPPPKPPTVTPLKTPAKPPTVTPLKTPTPPKPPTVTPPKPPTPPKPVTPPKVTPTITPVRAVPFRPRKVTYQLIIATCVRIIQTRYGKVKLIILYSEVVRPTENLYDKISQLRGINCHDFKVYTFDHLPTRDDIERALANYLYHTPL